MELDGDQLHAIIDGADLHRTLFIIDIDISLLEILLVLLDIESLQSLGELLLDCRFDLGLRRAHGGEVRSVKGR